MAISFRSSISHAGNSATINAPTGVASGDMLVACVYDEVASGTWTPPSGWTLLDATQDTSSTAWIHTYYKVAGASEPASYTWTVPAGSWTSIYIVAFNSGGASLSIDAHAGNASSTSAASPNVTTTASGDAVVIFGTNFSGTTETAPSSPWTADTNQTYAWFRAGYQIAGAAGSIGAFTFESTHYGLGSTVAITAGSSLVSGSPTLEADSALSVAGDPLQATGVLSVTGGIAGSGGTPSTIGTTTESLGLGSVNAHLTAYSAISGSSLWYAIYNDGSNWVYRTSSDGSTWSAATTVTGMTGDPGAAMGVAGLVVDSSGVLHFMAGLAGGSQSYTQYTASGWWATPNNVYASGFAGVADNIYESGGHKYIWMWGYASGTSAGGDVAEDPISTTSLSTFGFGLSTVSGASWANRNRAFGIEFYGTSGIVLATDQAATPNIGYHTFDPTALTTGQFPTAVSALSNANLDANIATGVDSNGHVHVIYRITGTGWLEAVWNGTTWTTGGTLPQITDNDLSPALALDSNGVLHCFYARYNAANDYGVGHLTYNGTSWSAKGDTVAHNSTNRQTVTVSRKDGGGNLLVMWLEGTASPYTVKGILVSTNSALSGSATLAGNSALTMPVPMQSNGVLTVATDPLPAQGILTEPTAAILAPATAQSNAVLSETTASILAPASLPGNATIAETAHLLAAPAAVPGNSGISVAAQLVTHATEQGNAAASAAPAQIAAPAVMQANSVLSVTGGLASGGGGGGTLAGNSVLTETAAHILAPATAQSNAALAVSAVLLASVAAMQASSGLSVAGQIVAPAVPLAAQSALIQSAALVLAQPTVQGNAALAVASALVLAASAALQGNSVLAATGHIPLAANYHSPVGTTASAATRLTGATARLSTELVGATTEE